MSSELIILSFPSKHGAKRFLTELLPLQEQHLIRIDDAALAMKDDDGRVFGSMRTDLTAHGLISGSLWGTLTGALFLEPFLGLILGGTVGLLTGSFISQAERGVSTTLVKDTAKRALEPGHSALFLLVSKATPDKVMQKMRHHDATVVGTSLSIEQERRLRDTWSQVRQDGALALHDREKADLRPVPSFRDSQRTRPLRTSHSG